MTLFSMEPRGGGWSMLLPLRDQHKETEAKGKTSKIGLRLSTQGTQIRTTTSQANRRGASQCLFLLLSSYPTQKKISR